MTFAEALYTALTADAGLSALVSTRIYPVRPPQGVVSPFIVWQEISHVPYETHGEVSTAGLRDIQLTCVADTYDGALALSSATLAALESATYGNSAKCLTSSASDGFSEDTNQFLRLVESSFFSSPA